MVPRFSVMRSRAGRGSEGIGQGSGAVPRRAPGTRDAAEGDPAAVPVEFSAPSRRRLPGKHPTSGPNYRQELFCEIPNPHGTARDWEQIYLRRGLLFPALPFPPTAQSSLGKPQHGAGADGMWLLVAAWGSPHPQTLVWMHSPKEENFSSDPRTRPTKLDMHRCLFWFLIIIQIITQP